VEILGAVAGIVSVLTSWIIGVRLLALARRNHAAPELLCGLGLLLTGGVWSPLIAMGRQATALSDPLRAGLVLAGALVATPGITCLALFNWRVFRPSEGWGLAFGAAIALTLAGLLVAQTLGPGWFVFARDEQGPWIFAIWAAVASYVWANVEAWRHYSMLARRQRLGLADPVVVDRMRLWALAMLAAILAATSLGTCQMLGIPVAGTVPGLLVTVFATVFTSICLWLAFLPPASYLAAVRQRAVVGV
jgi:hypothetical protein